MVPSHSSPHQRLPHLSYDTSFPTFYNQVSKASPPYIFLFFYTFALIFLNLSSHRQQKPGFSFSQLVINSLQEATGVFQPKLFMSCYFQQRCSLLWTLLSLACITVAKSGPVNTVTTLHSASEWAGVAKQRQFCQESRCEWHQWRLRYSQGVYNKSCIWSRLHFKQPQHISLWNELPGHPLIKPSVLQLWSVFKEHVTHSTPCNKPASDSSNPRAGMQAEHEVHGGRRSTYLWAVKFLCGDNTVKETHSDKSRRSWGWAGRYIAPVSGVCELPTVRY